MLRTISKRDSRKSEYDKEFKHVSQLFTSTFNQGITTVKTLDSHTTGCKKNLKMTVGLCRHWVKGRNR